MGGEPWNKTEKKREPVMSQILQRSPFSFLEVAQRGSKYQETLFWATEKEGVVVVELEAGQK